MFNRTESSGSETHSHSLCDACGVSLVKGTGTGYDGWLVGWYSKRSIKKEEESGRVCSLLLLLLLLALLAMTPSLSRSHSMSNNGYGLGGSRERGGVVY